MVIMKYTVAVSVKGAIQSQLNLAILLWRHTWRKNSETAQFWQAIAQASELFFPVVCHTHNRAVHSGNPTHIQFRFSSSFLRS